MVSLNGSIALICTLGIYTMGANAYAEPDLTSDVVQEEKSLTLSFLSFFDRDLEKKDIGPEVILLEKPAKENADQYITLSEPAAESTVSLGLQKREKEITVKQSFVVQPSLMFNMGRSDLSSPALSGFSDLGATTIGHHVTFSYGEAGRDQDPKALGISIGSQFLVEPSSIMSPLFDGSEFDHIGNRQVYNLSVGMGYGGFKLGASYSRERMLYDAGLKGFDIGLGYTGRKWGADVKFGEYKRERDWLFASSEEFYNTVYALEIGAAYQLYSNIRFTGRFTYYSYGQESELDKLRSSQVFFLGTNVNF
ncbi:MAG: hypothetical protein JKY59_06920 [Emcibacter sp.]|nr:hypothetical protein [Emcibacter sp.]